MFKPSLLLYPVLASVLVACGAASSSGVLVDDNPAASSSSGTAPPATGSGATPPVVAGSCTLSAEQQALLTAHNQARSQARKCGDDDYAPAPALAWHCTLAAVSEQHSRDMATNNFFDHDGSNGLSPFDRMRNAGYQFRRAGENIAAGQTTVERVMDGWLKSPGHCANIMNSGFTEMGGARVSDNGSQFRHYWTVGFGAR